MMASNAVQNSGGERRLKTVAVSAAPVSAERSRACLYTCT